MDSYRRPDTDAMPFEEKQPTSVRIMTAPSLFARASNQRHYCTERARPPVIVGKLLTHCISLLALVLTISSTNSFGENIQQNASNTDDSPLICTTEQRGKLTIFSAQVRDKRTTSIVDWRVENGHCESESLIGKRFGKKAIKLVCAANYGSVVSFYLKTKRGNCAVHSDAGDTLTFNGVTTLDEDSVYQAGTIEFAPKAQIISNGFNLYIAADNKIVIGEGAEIKSFLASDTARALSRHGRHAALITISAPTLEGKQLTIANHGEDGTAGKTGSNGSTGGRGRSGAAGIHRGVQACVGRRNAGPGKKGGDGEQGGNGGDAGNGGSVVLQLAKQTFNDNFDKIIIEQSRINPYTKKLYRCEGSCPGSSGPGGKGGKGGNGGPGGIAGIGQWPCLAGSPGKKGSKGKAGLKGNSGRTAVAGHILLPRYYNALPHKIEKANPSEAQKLKETPAKKD